MEIEDDIGQQPDADENAPGPDAVSPEVLQRTKALVSDLTKRIKDDKRHHEKAFKRMRRDMKIAMWGADETWADSNYKANISGRHVKMKTAALYAKNPKIVARRRETLDFALWDESPEAIQLAFQTVQMASQVAEQAMAMAQPDPMTGEMVAPEPPPVPGLEEAQALLTDFQQGMQRRQMLAKFGKTLEILFAHGLREQKPLDFKRAMKAVVRRACTTGVGYAELGYQREMGRRSGWDEQLADARTRLDHMRVISEHVAEGEVLEDDKELAELELSIKALQEDPEIVLREGLILDYPQSTKVIPDRLCKSLEGFVGARHLTIEYHYSVEEVNEVFGVDLSKKDYTGYTMSAGSQREISVNDVFDEEYSWEQPAKKKNGLVCVWKHYDKATGLVYLIADGYQDFLREPSAPDVFVEGFWPVYALTFNAVESEDELFPPSDVALLLDMQREYNRARQGLREHRDAARPRWIYSNGAFGSEEDPMLIRDMKPFEMAGIDMTPGTKIGDIMQSLPVPGVDPNLYETGQLFNDMQLVGGAQEAQYGGTTDATATESAIAASSTNASDASSVDDLDGFLTALARDGGQILMREMSEERVMEVVGPGAVWPQMSLAEIMKEVNLEVEAGSTGKPNQAVEMRNWTQMLPFLLQLGSINPMWLARESLRRLDDRLDLTEAIAAGIPSIVAMNQQKQVATGPNDPNAQGGEGADNAQKPERPGGSEAPMGSNRETGVPTGQADGTVVAA